MNKRKVRKLKHRKYYLLPEYESLLELVKLKTKAYFYNNCHFQYRETEICVRPRLMPELYEYINHYRRQLLTEFAGTLDFSAYRDAFSREDYIVISIKVDEVKYS